MSNHHHDSKHTGCGCRGGRIYVTTMIKEAYCSFEVSKLLREKGFDGECRMMYREHDKHRLYYIPDPNHIGEFTIDAKWIKSYNKKTHAEYLLAPTHQMATAWLREKGIYITIIYGDYPANKKVFWTPQIDSLEGFDLPDSFYQEYDLYEDAVESALKYSLKNLI